MAVGGQEIRYYRMDDDERQLLCARYVEIQFPPDIPRDLLCQLCERVPINHFHADCGHNFCHVCRHVIRYMMVNRCPICNDQAGEMINKTVNMEVRLVALNVPCVNYVFGCNFEATLLELPDHIKNCAFEEVDRIPRRIQAHVRFHDVAQARRAIVAESVPYRWLWSGVLTTYQEWKRGRKAIATSAGTYLSGLRMASSIVYDLRRQEIYVRFWTCTSSSEESDQPKQISRYLHPIPEVVYTLTSLDERVKFQRMSELKFGEYLETDSSPHFVIKMNPRKFLQMLQSDTVIIQVVLDYQHLYVAPRSINGRLVWRIDDFARQTEMVYGFSQTVMSGIFYTHTLGYKMRLKLENSGTKTFIASLLAGENDSHLPQYPCLQSTVYCHREGVETQREVIAERVTYSQLFELEADDIVEKYLHNDSITFEVIIEYVDVLDISHV